MANLANYAEKGMLDHTLGFDPLPFPNPAYLAAFRAAPGETGSLASEPSGNGYARVSLASKMAATVLASGLVTNSATISFPQASGADWGTIVALGVCDAATPGTGNVLIHLPLFSAMIVRDGGVPLELVPGALRLLGIVSNPNGMTRYLAKKWLDHLFGIAEYTQPSGLHLGMFSADPGADGSLSNEIATGSYGRQAITAAMAETVLETGIALNDDALAFPDPTANYNVTHYGIMDAASAGNVLLRKARGSTLQVISGAAPVEIASGQLAVRAA